MNWLKPLYKLTLFHAVFKSPSLCFSLISTQGNRSPVIWILLKRVCNVPAFWNSESCAKRRHSSWLSDVDKMSLVISVMKIKLKEEPWHIAPCSIKIKLSRSVTTTADDSNSRYMQAYGTLSLKTLAGFGFTELPSVLQNRCWFLVQTDTLLTEFYVITFSQKSQRFQRIVQILHCRKILAAFKFT